MCGWTLTRRACKCGSAIHASRDRGTLREDHGGTHVSGAGQRGRLLQCPEIAKTDVRPLEGVTSLMPLCSVSFFPEVQDNPYGLSTPLPCRKWGLVSASAAPVLLQSLQQDPQTSRSFVLPRPEKLFIYYYF